MDREPTAADRIGEALAGKTRGKKQLCAVSNLDMAEVAGSVPEDKRSRIVHDLLKGARGAGQKNHDGEDVPVEVFIYVDDLFHLLNAAGTK